MKVSTRIKSSLLSFASLGIKFLFPIFLSYYGDSKDFSFLLISYNLLLTSGYIFSFEHHKFYHRKAIQKDKVKNLDFYERLYFDKTLIIKLLFVCITLFFFKLSIFQRIVVFFIIFFDLHLVENMRKSVTKGSYFMGTLVAGSRISFPIIIFLILFVFIKDIFLEMILISTLISFISITFIFKIRVFNFKNTKLEKILFLKLTKKVWRFTVLVALGLLTPFVDKLILLNFEEYNMIQSITLWSLFGNIAYIFIFEFINKPYQPKIINFIKNKEFTIILRNIITYSLLMLVFLTISIFIFRSPINYIIKPVYDFNILQIMSCILIPIYIPINSFLENTLYGYSKDTSILVFKLIDFLIKYFITLFTILFLNNYFLPYTLAISGFIYILIKYKYIKNKLYLNS